MLKKYRPNKYISYLFFFIPILFIMLIDINREGDIWFLFSHGDYVLHNGFPKYDFLSMHNGFNFVMQQWLSAVIFYLIYHVFGNLGFYIFFIVINIVILYLLYKLCMVISKGRVFSSVIISSSIDLLLSTSLLIPRPQLFSFIIFILFFIVMEKFYQNKDKIIYVLPVLSLLLVNLHGALWLLIFVFSLPYLCEYIYLFIKKKDNYLKDLIISLVLSFLVGFINPYGFNTMSYIFYSYGNSVINDYIVEMKSFSLDGSISTIYNSWLILLIFFFICSIMFIRRKDINIHQVLLLFGTFTLALLHLRNMGFFIIFGLAFISKYINIKDGKYNYFPKTIYIILIVFIMGIFFINIRDGSYIFKSSDDNIINYLKRNNIKNITIYTYFNNGAIYEYYGYKAYIDPRAELYLKSYNKKSDVLEEYINLINNKIDVDKFLDKYKFDYMVVSEKDYLCSYLRKVGTYILVYHDNEKYLFKRNV